MAVTLGWVPLDFTLALANGGDFVTALDASPTDWPAGTGIEIRIGPSPEEDLITTVWPATITGSLASWNVPATQVQTVLDAQDSYAWMYYIEPGGGTLLWMKGAIKAY